MEAQVRVFSTKFQYEVRKLKNGSASTEGQSDSGIEASVKLVVTSLLGN